MELCRGFSVTKWKKLRALLPDAEEGWREAISVFERRMRERFFRCIDLLLAAEEKKRTEAIVPGFAIMALACLIAETLQSFYDGGIHPVEVKSACTYLTTGKCAKEPSTARTLKEFLKNSPHFNKDFKNSEIRGDFSHDVRNALLHEAETRKGWLIEKTCPTNQIVNGKHGSYVLNRTKFCRALLAEFEDYLAKLRDPANRSARENFLAKMDSLCTAEPKFEDASVCHQQPNS